MGILSWLAAKLESTKTREDPGWVRRLVIPAAGKDDPKLDALKRAAAEDVAAMEKEDREYFRQDGPERREDDL